MCHIIIGSASLGVTMLGLASVRSVASAIPAALLVGVASILYLTSTTAIIQVEADRALHGRVLALQTFVLVGAIPVGGPILGWLADTRGARAPIVLGAIVCLAAAVFGTTASRFAQRSHHPAATSDEGEHDDADHD
jgi:MFS family permease